ncbi:MAG: methyltransferase domain-containing protein [Bacteroidia bacterium]|nr:methyltransferase domain-containing protein [Bacteroidia bacterium]
MDEYEVEPWYREWFNSPFYHKLYCNRNEDEARNFIRKIVEKLNLPDGAEVLDLACGKGRHALTLSENNFNVTGVDLSFESIAEAKKNQKANLHFFVHDMRIPFAKKRFNCVFNLFTSFGYFESPADNLKTLNAVTESLKKNGLFVQDFFNSNKVIRTLVPHEKKPSQGTDFYITRVMRGRYLYKDINLVDDEGRLCHFREIVEAISQEEFKDLYKKAKLGMLEIYGSYDLEPFDIDNSDRLIMVSKKL